MSCSGAGTSCSGRRCATAPSAWTRSARSSELPIGWGDEQDAAHYRLRRRDDDAAFGYAVGPDSPKTVLFPPRRKLWQAERDGMIVTEEPVREQRTAFLGVRACELAAIAVLDRVFLGGAVTDPAYASGRRTAFFVAVTCSDPGGTCFCADMDAGPAPRARLRPRPHRAARRRASIRRRGRQCRGRGRAGAIPSRPATGAEVRPRPRSPARRPRGWAGSCRPTGCATCSTTTSSTRAGTTSRERCLSCGNCTLACPTCFCATVDDVTDLPGRSAQRWWVWDSCFTATHSYLHGGSVRLSTLSRYRQWMTHKLAAWVDQFGMSGCVGCGRCITWCPAAIDITAGSRRHRGLATARHRPARR